MAGLYIHIPFCRQACHYCDFHFSTSLKQKDAVLQALQQEIVLQKEYLSGETVETVYFGGGTPSLLSADEINTIFSTISRHITVADSAEVTLEANPDDLNRAKLRALRQTPVNRFSIGIQSFYEPHLRFLNRAHTTQEAHQSIKEAQDAGFSNLTIDLIYAIPHPDHSVWEADLTQAIRLDVPHISAYCLTIEPQTTFGNWLRKGKIQVIDEHYAADQFEMLVHTLHAHGYEQYEISNFARPGKYSRHNTAYWMNRKYLGIGPSAHSFNGSTRQYNVLNNARYIAALQRRELPFTLEQLTPADRVNEYIMTSLRTQWGCSLVHVKNSFDVDLKTLHPAYLQKGLANGLFTLDNEVIRLTLKGKLMADRIAANLFTE